MLQGSVTDAGPVHVPPFASSTVFCLFLVRFPPPHVTLQVPVVHDPHSQLTLRDKIKRLLNLTISIAMKSNLAGHPLHGHSETYLPGHA